VQEFGARVKAVKPWVKFGISPFGIWRNKASDPLGSDTNGTQSYEANFADTRKWVKEEWIDYILPQVYWNIGFAVADYAKLVPWWSDVVAGTRVQLYIGQADYKISAAGQPAAWFDPTEMSKHLTFNEDYLVSGNVHFSAKDVKADRLGATGIYAAEHYAKPALVPAMAHLPAEPLMFPVITDAHRDVSGATTLTWRGVLDGRGPFGSATGYAVYRFDGTDPTPGPCGFADATHLVATQRATGSGNETFVDTTAEPGTRYTYFVSALDRLWNESPPSPPRPVTG
jgi:glycosyl hydrolase family 10